MKNSLVPYIIRLFLPLLLGILGVIIIWFMVITPVTAQIGNFFVSVYDDDLNANLCQFPNLGDCSLRAAIIQANENNNSSQIDQIILTNAGTYELTIAGANEEDGYSGDLDILEPVTISGPEGSIIKVTNPSFDDRLFQVFPGTFDPSGQVTMKNLTLEGGRPADDGGGIYINSGIVTLNNIIIQNNQTSNAGRGGGLYNNGGQVNIIDSDILSNTSDNDGGGFFNNDGTIEIENSTIDNNLATNTDAQGGGFRNKTTVLLDKVTISNNQTYKQGGGFFASSGLVQGVNITISGNQVTDAASGKGAGISSTSASTVSLKSATLIANEGGANAIDNSGFFVLSNTIVAGNITTRNCKTTVDGISNIQDDTTGDCNNGGSFTTDVNVFNNLGPLINNGGDTKTHALQSGNPAIDGGSTTECPAQDQRGFNRDTSQCDVGAFERSDLTVSLNAETTILEGTGGTGPTAMFTATLSSTSLKEIKVNYATADGTATAGTDYTAKSGTLTFSVNQTQKFISIPINPDSVDEGLSENFSVNLSQPVNVDIDVGSANGVIVDDDGPAISISDVSVVEGNSPTTVEAIFTVSLAASSQKTVSVSYATADNTAVAPGDYTAKSGTLTFAPSEIQKNVSITVQGDDIAEADETFFVNLSNPTNGTIGKGQGIGTITDDEPSLSIYDVSVTEGNTGTVEAVFEVRTPTPLVQSVTVNYAVEAGGSATIGTDLQSSSGTLSFVPNELLKTLTITIISDTVFEPDENFFVRLSPVSNNITIIDDLGEGIILNDDLQPPSLNYLPLVMQVGQPDLIVESADFNGSTVQVIIKNIGGGPVTSKFWVDLYVDPNPPPTGTNQIWNDGRSQYGIVWGINDFALPLEPQQTLTLTLDSPYYVAGLSNPPPSFNGSQIYVQVDSANLNTTYGGVGESDETNNIIGPLTPLIEGSNLTPIDLTNPTDTIPLIGLPPR